MRDLVCARGGKLLLGYAGDALLLVDLASASVRALDPPPAPTPAAPATAPASAGDATNGGSSAEEAPPKQPQQQQKKKGATPPPLQVEGLGQIEAVALSADGALAAAVYRHKVLALWSTAEGALLAHRVLPKKALALLFGNLKGEQVVIVHDKVGDVRAYPAAPEGLDKRSALLLGHTASVGTCLALSPDGGLLASGDRDEKVRVSRFPCTLVMQGYLTGHENFVSAVRFLPGSPQRLLTASGDGTLGLWDAETCAPLATGAVDPAAVAADEGGEEKEEADAAAEGEEGEGPGAGLAKAVPLALAVTADGGAAVTTVLGRAELRALALPGLDGVQVIATPSPALGVDAVGESLFASLAAPDYLGVWRRGGGGGGAFELVGDHPVAAAVRAFASERRVGTEIVHAAEDEGLLGGMTKENLTERHTWNDRKRKDGVKERLKERGKRRRAKGRDGGEDGGEGEGDGGEDCGDGEGEVAMEA